MEDRPRTVAEPGLCLPLLERLPEHVGQETDEDVRLDARGLLMPDRSDAELTLLNAKGRLGLPQLHVRLPHRLGRPVRHVGAQDVAALALARVLVPLRPHAPAQAEPRRRRRVRHERDAVAAGGARVAPEEPPDLPLEGAAVERLASVREPLLQPREPRFDPRGEALMHRPLLLAPLGRAAEEPGLVPGPARA